MMLPIFSRATTCPAMGQSNEAHSKVPTMMTSMSARKPCQPATSRAKFARLMLQFFDENPSPAISSFSEQQLDELFDLESKGSLNAEMFFETLTKFQIKFQAPDIRVNSASASAGRIENSKAGSKLHGAPRVSRRLGPNQKVASSSAAATGSPSGAASSAAADSSSAAAAASDAATGSSSGAAPSAAAESSSAAAAAPNAATGFPPGAASPAAAEPPPVAAAAPDAATSSPSGVAPFASSSSVAAAASAKSSSVASLVGRAVADDALGCGQKRRVNESETYTAVPPNNNGGARANYQICLLDGKPNQIFDQIGNCFKNSIGLIMREINDSVYSRLQSPNLTTGVINTILNLGGYVLRKLPLFFTQHCNRLFKPEMPYLLAILLENQFEVQLPWLKIDPVDPEEADRRVRNIVASMRQMLPFLILNPFNKHGVAMHTIGLDCRFQRAMVLDPANANSFPFTLQNLNAVCDGRWTPSFRHIWVICRR